jgi:hypothetical protein
MRLIAQQFPTEGNGLAVPREGPTDNQVAQDRSVAPGTRLYVLTAARSIDMPTPMEL